jgi:AcrR family transcriptional regulator
VSPSTFFRYFPTKEDVVLNDDMDTRVLETLARQPADLPPLAAIRAAIREAWDSFTDEDWAQISEGARLSVEVPEIRARSMNEFARTINTINTIAGALADRTGRCRDDLRVRVIAGAVVGTMMAVFLPERLAQVDPPPDVGLTGVGPGSIDRIDEALGLLEDGLPL